MKKLTLSMLVLCGVMSLSACNKDETDESTTSVVKHQMTLTA